MRDKRLATDQEIAAALEHAAHEAEQAHADRAAAKAERDAVAAREAASRKLDRVRRKR